MKDPSPENIQGVKKASHSVNWDVNVSHLLIAIAAIYAIYRAGQFLEDSDAGDNLQDLAGSGGTQEQSQVNDRGGPTG